MQNSLTCLNVNCKLDLQRFPCGTQFQSSNCLHISPLTLSVIQMYCWNLDVMVLRTMYMSSLWLHLCSSYVYVQYIWFHLCSVTHIIHLWIRIYVTPMFIYVLLMFCLQFCPLSMFNLCSDFVLFMFHLRSIYAPIGILNNFSFSFNKCRFYPCWSLSAGGLQAGQHAWY